MTEAEIAGRRVLMAMIGAAAGLAAYVLAEVINDYVSGHSRFWVTTAAVGFFVPLLALIGPVRPLRAAGFAAIIALVSSTLVTWAALRYDDANMALAAGHPMLAYAALITLPLPFAIAASTGERSWRSYRVLFDQSWSTVVRAVAAWLFVGIVWGLVYLSDAVLQIVGLTVIEDLLDIDVVPYLLTGLVLGLALAVVFELSDYISPQVILRLLRPLLPVVLVVVVIFVAVLPFRGLGALAPGLSPGATLLAMALAAATLVTTAVERDADRAVEGRLMRGATQALALVLPVVAAMASYAVWLRVGQYGWTPNRLVAATGSAAALGYGVLYAAEVARRGDWMARLRRDNTGMALMLIAVAALWLTPVLDAGRISTASQIARFEQGTETGRELAVFEMAQDWGKAGAAGLEQLEMMDRHPDYGVLVERIAAARAGTNHNDVEFRLIDADVRQNAGYLAANMPVFPDGSTLAADVLLMLGPAQLAEWRAGCERRLAPPAAGPGCVAVAVPGAASGRQWVVLVAQSSVTATAHSFLESSEDRVLLRQPTDLVTGQSVRATPAMIAAIQAGDFEIGPSSGQSLFVGGAEVFPNN